MAVSYNKIVKEQEFAAKEKLEIVNALGFVFHFDFAQCRHFARPPIPSPAKRDEDRIPFELFQEFTANKIATTFAVIFVQRENKN